MGSVIGWSTMREVRRAAEPADQRAVPRLGAASVRVRITSAAVVVVGGSLLVGSMALIGLLRADTLRSVRTDAQVRAAEVAAMALRAPLPRPLPAVVGDLPTLIQVVDAEGNVSTASAPLLGRPALVRGARGSADHGRSVDLTFSSGRSEWFVQALPSTLGGRSATVIVATSLAPSRRLVRQLTALLAFGIPMLMAVSGVAAWAMVGRALRPVDRLRARVDSLALAGASTFGARVSEPPSQDEIGRLARTLNLLLERVEASARAQRRFVADASHELRGPIANIRVALEVAKAHPDRADWPAAADEVLAQDERMARLVEGLLLLARGDDDPSNRRREPVDLGAVLEAAVAHAVAAQPGRGNRIVSFRVTHRDPAPMIDDSTQLLSIVSNLVDNAARFATSSVVASLITTGGWVELTVSDDGPGIAPLDRERIFDRFFRLDEHRSRTDGGAGLGLAIVARLVNERGGVVFVGDAHRGATFTVRLPLVTAARPTGPVLSGSLGSPR